MAISAAIVAVSARPAIHLLHTAWDDTVVPEPPLAAGEWRDGGALESYAVGEVRVVPNDEAAALDLIRANFARARATRTSVSFAGARHSMGGQTAARDGIVLDMNGFRGVRYDADRRIVTVRSGTPWSDVIRELDRHGRSVAVMQSNNVFSIGGSVSVNAHGWQPLSSPLAGSVASLRAVLPDGRVATLSREHERELFSLMLGGYGLFGAILDVDLETVPNQRYERQRWVLDSRDYAGAFAREVAAQPAKAGLVYGRLCVAPSCFLQEALLAVYHPDADPAPPVRIDESPSMLARLLFRGQIGSAYGKELRWSAEKFAGERPWQRWTSRNQILDEGISGYANRDMRRAEVLQEYFVPRESLNAFVDAIRPILRDGGVDLLNVTLRDVAADRDSFLRYADRDMFCIVMYFHVERSEAGDARLRAVNEQLTDAALDHGGRYYLPYRLHARPEQFHRAYPQAERFFALKRQYDPDDVLSNEFYRHYATR